MEEPAASGEQPTAAINNARLAALMPIALLHIVFGMFIGPFFQIVEALRIHHPARVVKPMPRAQERRHVLLACGRIKTACP